MRKYRSAYLKPYMRRKTKKDVNYRDCDFRTYLRLCFPHFKYVMVQRGTNHIIACGRSKQELKREIFIVKKNNDFKKWTNNAKRIQQKASLRIRRGNDLSTR
ncbi:hypothetical protein ABHA37_08095 [Clostridium tertium]|uniref:hypothetical protein n=2 Tax=Clostridium tertium TaxID=1559 RepID=UPI00232C8A29|nr:hypothetical protein [Clostridium tertium]MDB1923373.1 hypothetical protein [Clostridium tertium]MDB1929978.1 hypothetical protein [Clostridium tertium]